VPRIFEEEEEGKENTQELDLRRYSYFVDDFCHNNTNKIPSIRKFK